jgi:hypothetical protein
MKTNWPLAAVVSGLVALAAVAAPETSERVTCTLTNQTVDKCCCVQREDGTLYCTLAKTPIESCCCKPADEKS